MKSNIIKEFNLPGYIKGKSFAEASKAIDTKFKDRTDPYAQKTKEELLERLAEAQEYVKMKEQVAQQSMKQSMDNNAQEVPDQMQGQVPEGMEEFMPQQQRQQMQSQQGMQEIQNMIGSQNQKAEGGFLSDIGKNINSDKMSGAGAIMGGAQQALGFGQDLFGKTGVDTSGDSDYMQKKSAGMDAAGGALSGATTGMQIGGPIGAGVGALVGGVSKFIGAKKNNKDVEEANQKRDLKLNSQFAPNTFAKGGYTNKYDEGGLLNKIQAAAGSKGTAMQIAEGVNKSMQKDPYSAWMNEDRFNNTNPQKPQQEISYMAGQPISPAVMNQIKRASSNTTVNELQSNKDLIPSNNEELDTNTYKSFISNNTKKDKSKNSSEKTITVEGEKDKSFLSKNIADLMRLSPVGYNAIKSQTLDPAEVVNSKNLDFKYNPNYEDINALTNMIDQNNINKAVSESSGGNLGATMSGMLAGNLNKDIAKSKNRMSGTAVNRGEDTKAQQTDLGVGKFNTAIDNKDIETNMQNRGARESAKMNLEAASVSQLGQIGKEMQDRKIAAEATGYKYNGEFIKTDDGTEVKPSDLELTEKDGKFYDKDGYELSEKEVAQKAKNYKKKK